MTISSPASAAHAAPRVEDAETFTRTQRWTLLLIAAAAYAAGHLLCDAVSVFAEPGFGGSVLLDASPVSATIKAALIALLVGIAAMFGGRLIRPDVGLFAAAIALLAVRRAGERSSTFYIAHSDKNLFPTLAIECLVLGVVLGVLFLLTRRLVAMKLLPDDADFDHAKPDPEPLGQRLLATGTQVLVVLVLMMFVCRSDLQMQVTATLFVGALISSLCAVRFIPAFPSVWFWAGPLVAGVVAYGVAAASASPNLAIGEAGGYFAAVARALPLDFASAGVAGAIYGYWIGRKHLPN